MSRSNPLLAYNKEKNEEHIELIGQAAKRVHASAVSINQELKSQKLILSQINETADAAGEELGGVMKRMAFVFDTNKKRDIQLILSLIGSGLFFTFLVLVT